MSGERPAKRKVLLWCLGVAGAVIAGIALFVWLSPKLRVTQETFSSIRPHMTETEIEGLLGGRGSHAAFQPAIGEGAVAAWTDSSFQGRHETLSFKQWRTPDKGIKVGFDANGRAVYAILTTGAHMSPWEKLRWWIGM
jgi:hypothetical protein